MPNANRKVAENEAKKCKTCTTFQSRSEANSDSTWPTATDKINQKPLVFQHQLAGELGAKLVAAAGELPSYWLV